MKNANYTIARKVGMKGSTKEEFFQRKNRIIHRQMLFYQLNLINITISEKKEAKLEAKSYTKIY